MEIRFREPALAQLEIDGSQDAKYQAGIPSAFRKRINHIRQAQDERDLWAFQSWRTEKLKGARSHQYSIRLNDQWRLILEIETEGNQKTILVVSIEDYH